MGGAWQDMVWVVNCFYVWSINEQIYMCNLSSFVLHCIYTGNKDEWDLDGL